MEKLLLIPLEDTVVFPNMTVSLPLDVGDEPRVLLVPRHEGEYSAVGTVADVTEIARLPGGARVATLEGLYRGVIGAATTGPDGRLYVDVEERPDETPPPVVTRKLAAGPLMRRIFTCRLAGPLRPAVASMQDALREVVRQLRLTHQLAVERLG